MMKRLFCLVLALLTVLPILAACKDKQQTEVTTSPEETEDAYPDDLPADLKFEDQEMNILYTSFFEDTDIKTKDVEGDAEGDQVDSTVFNRNTAIEERFGLDLLFTDANEPVVDKYAALVQQLYSSNDATYDVIYHRGEQSAVHASSGYFRPWNDVPYLDLNADYWFYEQMQNVSFNVNRQYLLTGDLMISNYSNMQCIFFNKDRWDKLYPTAEKTIYEMVYDGEWTWESFFKMAADGYQDITGDGVSEDDYFGTHYESTTNRTGTYYPYTCGIRFTDRDDEGFPVLKYNTEKAGEMVERLYNFVKDGTVPMRDLAMDKAREAFLGGKMMFYTYFLSEGRAVKRDAIFNWGIVPFPKYDSTVEHFTTVGVGAGVYVIPVAVSTDRLGMIGAVMEAMCAHSSEKVVPYYYEYILKANQAGNPEDAGMIDFMSDHLTFDPMYWIGASIGGVNAAFRDLIFGDDSSNLSGYWATKGLIYEMVLEKMIEHYKKNNADAS